MPRDKQLTVQLANKPGTLAQVAQALGEAKVNMRALAVFEGRAKIIAEDPAKGRDALQKVGLYASIEDCLTVDMLDRPGSLETSAPGSRGPGSISITPTPGSRILRARRW